MSIFSDFMKKLNESDDPPKFGDKDFFGDMTEEEIEQLGKEAEAYNSWFDEFVGEPDREPDDSDDDIPEGCAACGGPYPSCTSSCPLFDD